MFEFVNQGGCNCCGFTHGGMGMQDFMALCSDVETDDGKQEKRSPWPAFMQDEIWSDRVKFRRQLKDTMVKYQNLYEDHGSVFVNWWLELPIEERKRCFQMPREELRVQFSTTYDFKTAYQVVMCSVLEQVEKFNQTGYKADGATDCEIYYEENLKLKRGAWTVKEELYSTDEGCDMFFGMLLQLGGPHLMPKRDGDLREMSKRAKLQAEGLEGHSDDEDRDEQGEEKEGDKGTQSFRPDRRLARLVIFRYFADMAWSKFKRAQG